MTALSTDYRRALKSRMSKLLTLLDATRIYQGSYAAGGSPNHATTGNRGRVFPWSKAAGQVPLGFIKPYTIPAGADPTVAGILGAESSLRVPKVAPELDGLAAAAGGQDTLCEESVAVTGASTIADVWKKVFLTDDGTGLTLTRTAPALPVGVIVNFKSATQFDVVYFTFFELALMALAGGDRVVWPVGVIAPVRTAAGDLLTGIVCPYNGRIVDAFAICIRAPTDADVDISVDLQIDGVNVTMGTIQLLHGDAVAAKKSLSAAPTAANVVHDGALIDVQASTVTTAGTATDPGEYNLYLVVEKDLGI